MLRLFRKSRVATERKSLGTPTEAEYALFTGGATSGSTIGLSTALTVPAVQASIRLIAEAAASLPMKVMRVDGGRPVEDPQHPVAKLLADQPNDYTSWFELIRDTIATALTYDRGAVVWVNRIGGEVREIVRYEPAYTTVDYSDDGRAEPSFRINNRPEAAQNVIHLRGPFAKSCLALAADAIAAAKDIEKHVGGLFANGARPSGVIEFPKSMGDEALKKMRAGWKAAHEGTDNTGKTAILWDGATFRPLTLDSTDAQLIENRKFQVLEIARAFRVPPSMIYDLDRATWSNSEQMGREFLVYSLEPWLCALEGAMRRALFLPEERSAYRVIFDRDDLTRADLGERATAYASLISSRVINPNQAREWENLPPYDEGEAYVNPNISTDAAATSQNDSSPADQQGAANGPQ
jgi:HK97 family phage portal protein